MTFTLPIASTQFLFEDACRDAQEGSEFDHDEFGLVLVRPLSQDASGSTAGGLLVRVERTLRQNTHEDDRFMWLDDLTLGIVAVADRSGLDAMTGRLRGVLDRAQLADQVYVTSALFPDDATTPQGLLEAARTRLRPAPPALGHTAGVLSGASPIRRQAVGATAPRPTQEQMQP